MIMEEVFPLLLGPKTSVERCEPLYAFAFFARPK